MKEIVLAIAGRETDQVLVDQLQTAVEDPKAILGDEIYYIIAAILPHVPIKDIPAATLSIPLPPPPPFPIAQGRAPVDQPRVRVAPVTPERRPPDPAKKYPGQ